VIIVGFIVSFITMTNPPADPMTDEALLARLENKAARIVAWLQEHGDEDTAKAERYREEANLYLDAAQRIRQLSGKISNRPTTWIWQVLYVARRS
jgi:hypothetical protein